MENTTFTKRTVDTVSSFGRAADLKPTSRVHLTVSKRFSRKSPLAHFVSNFNRRGHIPEGVYNVPHFDLHWNTVDKQDLLSIRASRTWDDTIIGILLTSNVFYRFGHPEHGKLKIWHSPLPVTCEYRDRLLMNIPADQKAAFHCTSAPGATTEPGMVNHLYGCI